MKKPAILRFVRTLAIQFVIVEYAPVFCRVFCRVIICNVFCNVTWFQTTKQFGHYEII